MPNPLGSFPLRDERSRFSSTDRRTSRVRRFGAVVATGGLLVLSACGSSGEPSGDAAKPPQSVAIGMRSQVTSLDPDRALSQEQIEILNLSSGTLTQFSADGSSIEPGLASDWTVSSDGLTYTLNLRPDLKFSDGSALHAADVVASFQRSMSDEANVNAGLISAMGQCDGPQRGQRRLQVEAATAVDALLAG